MSLLDVFLDIQKDLGEEQAKPVERVKVSLVEYLDKSLSSYESVPPWTPDDVVRVSHLLDLCPRQEALRAIHQVDKVKKIERGLRGVFDIGRAFHTLVQNEWLRGVLYGAWRCPNCGFVSEPSLGPPAHPFQCKEPMVYVEPEIFDPTDKIIGHADGIIEMGGQRLLLELKTVNAYMFSLLSRGPQSKHVTQANMYMDLLGLDRGVILYFNKDDAQLREFFIASQPSMVGLIRSRLRETRLAIQTKTIPDARVCDSASCARAKACPVRKICF